jgi:type II secretory pathway component PulC
MLRNYFLINIVLIIVLGLLGFKLYGTVRAKAGMPVPSETRHKKEKDIPLKRSPVVNDTIYEVIAKKDLFRPSRSVSEQKAGMPTEKDKLKNPPKLFGTIILNDEKTAILQDSESGKTKSYKLNDQISGFTITEIAEDKVVLARDGEKYEVKLRADKGIKPPARQTVQPVRNVPETKQRAVAPRQRRPRRVRRNVPRPPR